MWNKIIDAVGKRFRRWDRHLTLSKRQQFVIAVLLLTSGLVTTQLATPDFRYPMVAALAVASYILCAFCLREDLKGNEWATLLILPTMFTAAVSLFYFLLPVRWLTRLPVATLYAVGMYALLLTENIYNVAASRTIALLRAAHSVGFLLTLSTFFLLIQTLLALRLPAYLNSLGAIAITFPLTVQILWAMELDAKVGKRVRDLSVIVTAVIAEVMWIFSFWPAKTTLLALFLTTCFYGLAGMGQQYLSDRLYKRTVWEFFAVVAIVFILLMLASNWYNAT
jgi:hypothetical protein